MEVGSKTVIIARGHDSVHRKPCSLNRELLDPISEFGKIAGYEVNIQKSKAVFCTTMKYQKQKPIKHSIYDSTKKK